MKILIKTSIFLIILSTFCSFLFINNTAFAEGQLKEVDTIPSQNYTVVVDAGHGGLDVK